jgi:hypothetical protein
VPNHPMIAITEALLRSAIYCGPDANTAFRTAQQVFTDHGPLDRPDRSDTGL